ncbi:hypothetical protein Cadr_000018571 [Camelus dromedarius]|uniref:Uncharacterized protein n=1 Tax=Camelus dromedarius TaxID=9838 RepID=A0A5N4D395_CAMDR|nr:hypothetical protein Cadr_000018571 [Camelus dromedarius]
MVEQLHQSWAFHLQTLLVRILVTRVCWGTRCGERAQGLHAPSGCTILPNSGHGGKSKTKCLRWEEDGRPYPDLSFLHFSSRAGEDGEGICWKSVEKSRQMESHHMELLQEITAQKEIHARRWAWVVLPEERPPEVCSQASGIMCDLSASNFWSLPVGSWRILLACLYPWLKGLVTTVEEGGESRQHSWDFSPSLQRAGALPESRSWQRLGDQGCPVDAFEWEGRSKVMPGAKALICSGKDKEATGIVTNKTRDTAGAEVPSAWRAVVRISDAVGTESKEGRGWLMFPEDGSGFCAWRTDLADKTGEEQLGHQ